MSTQIEYEDFLFEEYARKGFEYMEHNIISSPEGYHSEFRDYISGFESIQIANESMLETESIRSVIE